MLSLLTSPVYAAQLLRNPLTLRSLRLPELLWHFTRTSEIAIASHENDAALPFSIPRDIVALKVEIASGEVLS
jgi:hypothetical protein